LSEEGSVLFWLENHTGAFPHKMTVSRGKSSKYQFYLLVRAYRKKIKARIHFVTYSKDVVNETKGRIEEHSIFDSGVVLYVLEGFNKRFVSGLAIPTETYVLAETDEGELSTKLGARYRVKRDVLKVLIGQMGSSLGLRGLLKLDWDMEPEDFEPVLRRAKILGWDEENVADYLQESYEGNLMSLFMRGKHKELLLVARTIGFDVAWRRVIIRLTEIVHFKALYQMGNDPQRIGKELALGYRRLEETEESARMWNGDDLEVVARRLVYLDRMAMSHPEAALTLLVANSGVGMKRL